jgi:hypothetical protein
MVSAASTCRDEFVTIVSGLKNAEYTGHATDIFNVGGQTDDEVAP